MYMYMYTRYKGNPCWYLMSCTGNRCKKLMAVLSTVSMQLHMSPVEAHVLRLVIQRGSLLKSMKLVDDMRDWLQVFSLTTRRATSGEFCCRWSCRTVSVIVICSSRFSSATSPWNMACVLTNYMYRYTCTFVLVHVLTRVHGTCNSG